MIVSEQNPKALGKTISQFDISDAKGPFAKTQFSMCTPEVRSSTITIPLASSLADYFNQFQINKELSTICLGGKPDSVILIGLETHVCIENTALDLLQNGYQVHTVADCCTSRTQEDRLLAFGVRKS